MENGVEENLKEWEKSDELTKSIEKAAAEKGVNISVPITEEKAQKLIDDSATTLAVTGKTLNVTLYGQEQSDYCAAASGKMIAKYYGVTHTQTHIYQMMDEGGVVDDQIYYYTTSRSEGGLGKTGSFENWTPIFSQLTSEINNNRPVVSLIPRHVRVCRGYSDTGVGLHYLKINDPLPVGLGHQFIETWGAETCHIYVK